MFRSTTMMKYVDQIRGRLKIKVKALNDGIVSSRNYSRYISGEYDLPYNVLEKYVKRLGLSIEDFFIYVFLENKAQYKPHLDFIEAVKKHEIDQAFQIYRRMNKTFKSEVSKLLLPIRHYELLFLNKQIMKSEFIDFLKSTIDFDKLLKSETVTREELSVLFICLEYCCSEDKAKIIDFMHSVIKDQKHIISLYFKHSRQQLAMSVVKFLVQNDSYIEENHRVIKDMINYLLDLSENFNMVDVLSDLLQSIIRYSEVIKDQRRHDLAVFYYCCYLIAIDSDFDKHIKEKVEFYQIYLRELRSRAYARSTLYHDLRYVDED